MNPDGNNPASTSRQFVSSRPPGRDLGPAFSPACDEVGVLAAEAQALLDAAAGHQDVEGGRLIAFARACLEMSDMGRLALAVLDGGLFAPRRALELATAVLRDAEIGTQSKTDTDKLTGS